MISGRHTSRSDMLEIGAHVHNWSFPSLTKQAPIKPYFVFLYIVLEPNFRIRHGTDFTALVGATIEGESTPVWSGMQ